MYIGIYTPDGGSTQLKIFSYHSYHPELFTGHMLSHANKYQKKIFGMKTKEQYTNTGIYEVINTITNTCVMRIVVSKDEFKNVYTK